MGTAACRIYAPNLVCVCVDKVQKGSYRGRIWHQYSDKAVEYDGTISMIHKMEQLYDQWNFPQSSTRQRGFNERYKKVRVPLSEAGEEETYLDRERVWNENGDKGTFIVRVKYRQNSTWQGEVIWAEKNEKQYFRSALELLKMMDSALDDAEEEIEK